MLDTFMVYTKKRMKSEDLDVSQIRLKLFFFNSAKNFFGGGVGA